MSISRPSATATAIITGVGLLTAIGIVLAADLQILPAGAERHEYLHNPPTTGSPGVRILHVVEVEAGLTQPFRFYTADPYERIRLGVIYIDEDGRPGPVEWAEWHEGGG